MMSSMCRNMWPMSRIWTLCVIRVLSLFIIQEGMVDG